MQKVVYKRGFSKYNISTIAARKICLLPKETIMAKYKKCPRCEINYILEEEEYCEICKQELSGAKHIDDDDIDEVDDETGLCPICRKNYLNDGETVCEACARRDEYAQSSLNDDIDEEEPEEPEEDLESGGDDDDWELSLEEMQDEEFSDEAFDEEEQEEEEVSEEELDELDDDIDIDDTDDEDEEDEDDKDSYEDEE